MDAVRVALLRDVLAGTSLLDATHHFAGTLRSRVVPRGGGLLLVGTAEYEPWHLAAHLVDEAAWSGTPELAPTLVRHRVPPAGSGAPHLSVGLERLDAVRRDGTLLVVAPHVPDERLLERVHGARRAGATVLALSAEEDGSGGELGALAHEALTVPRDSAPSLDVVQHLVSAAAGEAGPPLDRSPRRLRERLARLTEHFTVPPPAHW
ncbi:hypothetical protein [Streptomyces sp. NPDC049906]|uniref:hypothetical protein n=1 Tax=Streptomyces sp. NPDC049906 TaxID=3155656 RepID=UPI0034245DEB